MEKRGMNHQSPLPEYKDNRFRNLDISGNILDLMTSCPECQKKTIKFMKLYLAGTSVSNPIEEPTLQKLFQQGSKLHSYYHCVEGFEKNGIK